MGFNGGKSVFRDCFFFLKVNQNVSQKSNVSLFLLEGEFNIFLINFLMIFILKFYRRFYDIIRKYVKVCKRIAREFDLPIEKSWKKFQIENLTDLVTRFGKELFRQWDDEFNCVVIPVDWSVKMEARCVRQRAISIVTIANIGQ